jgi:hypothetical protein
MGGFPIALEVYVVGGLVIAAVPFVVHGILEWRSRRRGK